MYNTKIPFQNMDFQEAHKKLFQGPFGKPKHVPLLLERLLDLRYKNFYLFENEISIVVTRILNLLKNRKDFVDFEHWERTGGGSKPDTLWIHDQKHLIEIFKQVQITNRNNLDIFNWPTEVDGCKYMCQNVKLQHIDDIV